MYANTLDAARLVYLYASETPQRLYCFPPAGMGPHFYYSWTRYIDPGIELVAVHLPGRDRHPCPHSATDSLRVASQLAHLIGEEDKAPFAFFGHSIGALLAYETARHLRTQNKPLPSFLAISACPAPHLDGLARNITQASFDGLAARSDVYPSVPNPDSTTLSERVAYCEVALADSLLVLRHHHRESPPLDVPLGLYCGTEDNFVSADDIDRWNDLFTESATPHFYPGSHLYLPQANPQVVPQVSKDFNAALRTTHPGSWLSREKEGQS